MAAINTNPPKHLVREYLARRSRDPQPPPAPEEIRRQLGWGMALPAEMQLLKQPAQGGTFGYPDKSFQQRSRT